MFVLEVRAAVQNLGEMPVARARRSFHHDQHAPYGLANFFDDMELLVEPIQEELYQDLRRVHPRCWTYRPAAHKKFLRFA